MRDRREQLIWTELDGESSEAEIRELALLRDSGQADDLEEEIRYLAARLDEVESVAAPTELRERILEAVAKRGVLGGAQRGGKLSGRRGGLASAPSLAHFPARIRAAPAWSKWAAVAASLALALVAHQLAFGPGPEDASGLSGTVLPAAPEVGSTTLSDPAQLVAEKDLVRLAAREDRLTASFTPGEGLFTFAFRAPDLKIEQLDFLDGATGRHELKPDQLTLRIQGPGRAELVLVFGHPDRPITFSGFGDGLQPFERELFLGADR